MSETATEASLWTRVKSDELTAHVGETVILAGWLHQFRQLAKVSFLILRDQHGLTQIVVTDAAVVEKLASYPNESVVKVTGTVKANPQAPGGVEVVSPEVVLLSKAEEPPFDLFRPTINAQLPTILDHAGVALRHPQNRAYFEIMGASLEGFRSTLRSLDFNEIQTPKIVASATEGGANVFKIDYFGKPAYLAQSPQFYKQMMVGVFERVFEVGPVFRAEPHDTARHLSEYVSLDCEMGFIDDHRTVMKVLTKVIAGMVDGVAAHADAALKRLEVALPSVPEEIPVVHFADAQAMITKATGEDITSEPDLAPAHEVWLGEWAKKEHNSEFVFVMGYPMVKRPFYTHPQPDNPKYSNSFDLLFRGLELVTGGQRLHLYADYLAALERIGAKLEPFEGYLEVFKNGMPPHGGFAIGSERWVSRIVGAANVRETTLFPRDLNRLTP